MKRFVSLITAMALLITATVTVSAATVKVEKTVPANAIYVAAGDSVEFTFTGVDLEGETVVVHDIVSVHFNGKTYTRTNDRDGITIVDGTPEAAAKFIIAPNLESTEEEEMTLKVKYRVKVGDANYSKEKNVTMHLAVEPELTPVTGDVSVTEDTFLFSFDTMGEAEEVAFEYSDMLFEVKCSGSQDAVNMKVEHPVEDYLQYLSLYDAIRFTGAPKFDRIGKLYIPVDMEDEALYAYRVDGEKITKLDYDKYEDAYVDSTRAPGSYILLSKPLVEVEAVETPSPTPAPVVPTPTAPPSQNVNPNTGASC